MESHAFSDHQASQSAGDLSTLGGPAASRQEQQDDLALFLAIGCQRLDRDFGPAADPNNWDARFAALVTWTLTQPILQ